MRDRCGRELRELGFEVTERPFEYSSFPGRLATPLIGGMAAALVGFAGRWGIEGRRVEPFALLVVGGLVLAFLSRWFAMRGVLDALVLRQRGVNLEAVHPDASPRVWLCAHLDSKSQPIPTLLRSAGIVVGGLGYVVTLLLAALTFFGAALHPSYWFQGALLTLVGAIPVVLSVTGRRSPGALDNASGVTTVIAAARTVRDDPGVGVLITDAEEMGLAGARAWARQRAGHEWVLNCDGIDDDGIIQVMYTGKRPTPLLDAIARASATTGIGYHVTRLFPGILTDSVAFSDARMQSVTVSRGTLRSLVRVHTRRDDLRHLRGDGVSDAAHLLAAAARAASAVGGRA